MSVLSALPSLLPSALPTALPTALPSALPLISGVTYTLAHSTVKNLLFQVANVYDNGTDFVAQAITNETTINEDLLLWKYRNRPWNATSNKSTLVNIGTKRKLSLSIDAGNHVVNISEWLIRRLSSELVDPNLADVPGCCFEINAFLESNSTGSDFENFTLGLAEPSNPNSSSPLILSGEPSLWLVSPIAPLSPD